MALTVPSRSAITLDQLIYISEHNSDVCVVSSPVAIYLDLYGFDVVLFALPFAATALDYSDAFPRTSLYSLEQIKALVSEICRLL